MKNSDREELERYEQLMNDWKPTPPKRPEMKNRFAGSFKSDKPNGGSGPTPGKQTAAQTPMQDGAYPLGAIVSLNSDSIVIYKYYVPEKEYHLVAVLLSNGEVKQMGIMLEGYNHEEIGQLPVRLFEQMTTDGRWIRDLIVFHCHRWEKVKMIPERPQAPTSSGGTGATTNAGAQSSEPAESGGGEIRPNAAADLSSLRRGTKLKIKFGDKNWDAVYWGVDEQGTVVAHKTHDTWALMHLDLKRFSDGLETDTTIDQPLIAEIESNLGVTK